MRIVSITIILAAIVCAIGAIFWYQEGQYLLPTPLPKNYMPIHQKQLVTLDSSVFRSPSKPIFFHFFNPDCPCSRFNLKHFLSLQKEYNSEVAFYAIVTDESKASSAKKMIHEDIVVIVDKDEKIAKACGVYSTPQAALLQTDNTLFFRGNYNRARYCTDKNSNYVQMALDSLMAKKDPPFFSELATKSYGCVLSEDENALIP